MEKKLSYPERSLLKILPFSYADVHAINKDFPVFDADECFLDAALAHTQGLYLCPVQDNSGLVLLQYKIVMICFFVVGNQSAFRFCMALLPL